MPGVAGWRSRSREASCTKTWLGVPRKARPVTVMVKLTGAEVSCPPLAVPPSSCSCTVMTAFGVRQGDGRVGQRARVDRLVEGDLDRGGPGRAADGRHVRAD